MVRSLCIHNFATIDCHRIWRETLRLKLFVVITVVQITFYWDLNIIWINIVFTSSQFQIVTVVEIVVKLQLLTYQSNDMFNMAALLIVILLIILAEKNQLIQVQCQILDLDAGSSPWNIYLFIESKYSLPQNYLRLLAVDDNINRMYTGASLCFTFKILVAIVSLDVLASWILQDGDSIGCLLGKKGFAVIVLFFIIQ